MHLRRIGLLAFGAATVDAFRDTSPFIFASTSEILASSAQIKTATSLLDDVASKLSVCPSDYYVIASQPGVHVTDFSARRSAPRLREKVTGKDKAIRSSFTVDEVSGTVDTKYIQDMLEKRCSVQTTDIDASIGSYPSTFAKGPRIVNVQFPVLPLGAERAQQLEENDGFLADIVDRILSPNYTILYVTSPREFVDGEQSNSVVYHPDDSMYQDPVHMDLKRDYASHARRGYSSRDQSLFEEYQFLTPGIFMGLLAGFVFLAILYVGFSALLSLQVPYAAFEKDTAPSSQKKQQ